MCLAENKSGQQLLEYITVSEQEALESVQFTPITSAFAFIRCQNKYLIGYNKWRHQWEFPAGKLEANETLKACAIRELLEETNQRLDDLVYKGLFKIDDRAKGEVRYRAVYFAEVDSLDLFQENEEMKSIMLWDLVSEIGYVDAVDLKMLQMCLDL